MAGRLSFFGNQVQDNAKSGAKIGALMGVGLVAVSSVLTLLTGGALLLFPALMSAGICALSGGLSGGIVGSAWGALKGAFGRKPDAQAMEQDGMGVHTQGFAPDMQPEMSGPQQQFQPQQGTPTPMHAPSAPQQPSAPQTGTMENIAAAMKRGEELQARTADLVKQLQASGVGQALPTGGPETQQNWQASTQQAPQQGAGQAPRR